VVPAGNTKSFYLIGYLEVKQIQAHCVADVEGILSFTAKTRFLMRKGKPFQLVLSTFILSNDEITIGSLNPASRQ
jgi:hypothetical protein